MRLLPEDFVHDDAVFDGDLLLGIPPSTPNITDDFPTADKPDDVYRIVVLGDSHTVSVSSGDTYPEVLERMLNAKNPGGPRVEVHNAGAPGHSHYQHYLSLDRRLKSYQPDLVVVGFYLGNDFLDLYRNDDRPNLDYNGSEFVHSDPVFHKFHDTGEDDSWLASSRLYQLGGLILRRTVGYELDRVAVLWGVGKRGQEGNLAAAHYLYKIIRGYFVHQHIFRQSTNQTLFLELFPERRADIDRINAEITRRMKELTQAEQMDLLYLIIPTKLQIEPDSDPEVLQKTLDVCGFDRSILGFEDELSTSLAALLEQHDIEYITAVERLKERAKQGPIYEETYHVIEDAHVILAEALYEKIWPKLEARRPAMAVEVPATDAPPPEPTSDE